MGSSLRRGMEKQAKWVIGGMEVNRDKAKKMRDTKEEIRKVNRIHSRKRSLLPHGCSRWDLRDSCALSLFEEGVYSRAPLPDAYRKR